MTVQTGIQCPTGITTVVGASGTIYVADSKGIIQVTVMGDVGPLLNTPGFSLEGSVTGARNNLAGTASPGASNDNTQDYGVGSLWLDITNSTSWVCLSAATGAATWLQTGATQTTGTIVGAGQSGTAGTVRIFPTTASKGKVDITASDASGNTTTAINVAAQAGARTITVPDPGVATAKFLLSGETEGANGLFATPIPLSNGKTLTGTALPASATTNTFGYAITLGTSFALVGEVVNNNTKTDSVLYEYIVPAWYESGTNITVTVNASFTLGGGTLTTKTCAVLAYLLAKDGTSGANLGPAAQTVVGAGSDLAFTVTGTTLLPGSRVLLEVQTVFTETAASNVTTYVNSIIVS